MDSKPFHDNHTDGIAHWRASVTGSFKVEKKITSQSAVSLDKRVGPTEQTILERLKKGEKYNFGKEKTEHR